MILYLRRLILVLLLMYVHPSALSMDHASSSQIIVCESLPEEVWKQIFEWVNSSMDNQRLTCTYDDINDEKLDGIFDAIQNFIPYTRVCKVMYGASAPLIAAYLQLAETYVDEVDKHSELRSAVHSGWHYNNKLILLYRKLGADINHIHADGETAVTYAIKHKNESFLKRLIKHRADLMQPNARGQVPIDLAYEMNSDMGSKLKDNGGDPENRYVYYGKDKLLCVMPGGYRNYQQQRNRIALNVVQEPNIRAGFIRGFLVGVTVCGMCCWIYSKRRRAIDDEPEEAESGIENEVVLAPEPPFQKAF